MTIKKKGKRDIVGTNKAIYIKTWKDKTDIRVNNTYLKKACFNVAYLMRDFNEKDRRDRENNGGVKKIY